MNDKTLIWTGAVGRAVAAICCATAALVVPLGVAGLSAWLGWIDYVLYPALAIFLGVLVYRGCGGKWEWRTYGQHRRFCRAYTQAV